MGEGVPQEGVSRGGACLQGEGRVCKGAGLAHADHLFLTWPAQSPSHKRPGPGYTGAGQ